MVDMAGFCPVRITLISSDKSHQVLYEQSCGPENTLYIQSVCLLQDDKAMDDMKKLEFACIIITNQRLISQIIKKTHEVLHVADKVYIF